MADEFEGLRPWPDSPLPAHHNEPPLEDRVCIDFEESLHRQGLDLRAADIAQAALRAPEIDNPTVAGKAGDLIAAARAVRVEIEAERETLNRPLLTAQRALKAKADGILEPMETNVAALRTRLDEFMASAAAPVSGDSGARVGTRTVWLFEILEPGRVPLLLRRAPAVMEALEKVVGAHVRNGARKIAGVRIWSEERANVR